MCWEDIKIARKTHAVQSVIKVPLGSTVLAIQRNPNRFALFVMADNQDAYILSLNQNIPDANSGIIVTGQEQILLNLHLHGDMVIAPWYCRAQSVGGNLIVIESVLEIQTHEELNTYVNR